MARTAGTVSHCSVCGKAGHNARFHESNGAETVSQLEIVRAVYQYFNPTTLAGQSSLEFLRALILECEDEDANTVVTFDAESIMVGEL